MNFMERKRILMFGFAISTILFFIIMIILILVDFGIYQSQFGNLIGITAIFIANMAVDMCWYILQIYIMEYYATNVRATALGFIFYGIGSFSLIISFVLKMNIGTQSWI